MIGWDELAFLEQRDTKGRMTGLEQLLTLALGPRQESFGEPEHRLELVGLPKPLSLFYRYAGRWPSPHPERSPILYSSEEEAFFYAGVVHAHLSPLDDIERTEDGRWVVFWEQAGTWRGSTADTGADPPVWVQESGDGGELSEPRETEDSLSGWLVSHCLAAIAWEPANSYCCGLVERRFNGTEQHKGLFALFHAERSRAVRLWQSQQTICGELAGAFYIVGPGILVHDTGRLIRFAALTPQAAALLRAHAVPEERLE